jgi:hypothetical protein
MFLAGMLLLVLLMLRRNWRAQHKTRKQKKQNAQYLIQSPRPTNKEWSMSDGPKDVQRWQAELLETTRMLEGELNSKIVYLERSIALAKQQQEALSEQLHTASRQNIDTNDNTLSQLEDSIRTGESFDKQAIPNSQAVTEVLCDDTLREKIHYLASEGNTISQIGELTEVDAGAVEMILHLREQ